MPTIQEASIEKSRNEPVDERQKLSFDVLENEDEDISSKIEEISQDTGFVARAPVRPSEKSASRSSSAVKRTGRDRRRRAKTGRTFPFNTKIKPEVYDQICALADNATAEEGRPVSLAEIIERAVEALEAR